MPTPGRGFNFPANGSRAILPMFLVCVRGAQVVRTSRPGLFVLFYNLHSDGAAQRGGDRQVPAQIWPSRAPTVVMCRCSNVRNVVCVPLQILLREQASRFLAMAQIARDEGNLGLADLLTEAGRRAALVETSSPPTVPQEAGGAAGKYSKRPKLLLTDLSALRPCFAAGAVERISIGPRCRGI